MEEEAGETAAAKTAQYLNWRKRRAEQIAGEITSQHTDWFQRLLDLSIVVLLLSRIKKILTELKLGGAARDWERLKSRGAQFTRAQAVFVAAEATGQLTASAAPEARARLYESLGVLVQEGNSLHKVRALRALRALAAPECIPHIERGLRDSSSWVQATALHSLFRMNLQDYESRSLLRRFLLTSFKNTLLFPRELLRLFSDSATREGQPAGLFTMGRGLFSGMLRERAYGLLSLFAALYVVAGLWVLLIVVIYMVLICGLFFPTVIAVGVCLGLMAAYRRFGWTARVCFAALDFGTMAAAYYFLPLPQNMMAIGVFLGLLFGIRLAEPGRKTENYDRGREGLIWILRAAFLAASVREIPDGTLLFSAILGLIVVHTLVAIWLLRPFVSVQSIGVLVRQIRRAVVEKLHRCSETAQYLYSKRGFISREMARYLFSVRGFFAVVGAILLIPTCAIIVKSIVDAKWVRLVNLAWILALSLSPFIFDARAIVDRIRIPFLLKRPTQFKDFSAYLEYMFAIARSHEKALRLRVRAILALSNIALANQQLILRLQEFADEDLPPEVKDAIYQVVDASEKRIRRGQATTVGFETSFVKEPESVDSPETALRSYVLVLLALATLSAGIIVILEVGLTPQKFADAITLAWFVLGTCLVTTGVAVSSSRQVACLWCLIVGLGLFGLVLSHPSAVHVVRPGSEQSGEGEEFALLASISFQLLSAACGAFLGYLAFLLLCDVSLNLNAPHSQVNDTHAGKGSMPEERPEHPAPGPRINANRRLIWMPWLTTIVAGVLQAPLLEDFCWLGAEPLPSFSKSVQARNVFTLDNIPTDGRLIRVALVKLKDPETFPKSAELFPRIAQKDPSVPETDARWILRTIGDILPEDEVCKGEVWISAEEAPQIWKNLPNGLLEVVEVGDGGVTFRVQETQQGLAQPATWRLVAFVYNSTRSPWLRARVRPERVEDELRYRVEKGLNADARLFAETDSPLVRTVWGPRFSVSTSPE